MPPVRKWYHRIIGAPAEDWEMEVRQAAYKEASTIASAKDAEVDEFVAKGEAALVSARNKLIEGGLLVTKQAKVTAMIKLREEAEAAKKASAAAPAMPASVEPEVSHSGAVITRNPMAAARSMVSAIRGGAKTGTAPELDRFYVPRYDLTTNTGVFCSRAGEKLNLFRVFCTRTNTEASSSAAESEYEYPADYKEKQAERARAEAEKSAAGGGCCKCVKRAPLTSDRSCLAACSACAVGEVLDHMTCDRNCTRMGRRPCPGGWRVSSLAEMGAAVTAHYKYLKAIYTIFAVMLIFYLPQISINKDAGSPDAVLTPMAKTTVGNLSPMNGSLISLRDGAEYIDAVDLAKSYAGLDIFCVLLFTLMYCWVTFFLDREQKSVDKFTLTIQDYTVMVPNLPVDTRPKDISAWVERTVLSIPAERMHIGPMVAEINAGYKGNDESRPTLIEPPAGVDLMAKDLSLSQDVHNHLVKEVFKTAQVVLVPNHAIVLPLLQKMGLLRKKLSDVKGALEARAIRRKNLRGKCCAAFRADILATAPDFQCVLPATLCCCVKVAEEKRDLLVKNFVNTRIAYLKICDETDRAILRIVEQRRKHEEGISEPPAPCGLTNPLACLKKERVPDDPMPPVTAFVTFEYEEAKDKFMTFFPDDTFSWLLQPCVCPDRRLQTGGDTPVARRTRAVEAPMPSAIAYTNLHIGPVNKRIRMFCSNLTALIAILISFAVIFACSSQTSSLQSQLVPADCSEKKYAAFTKAYGKAAAKYFTQNPAKNSAVDFSNDENIFVTNLPAENKLRYCVCEKRAFASKYTTLDALKADKYYDYCPFQVCPVRKALGDEDYLDNPECEHLAELAKLTGNFSTAASIVVAVVNILLGLIIRKLSGFEGHVSTEKANVSVSFRLFLAQFFNTAVLVVLVNAAWGSVGRYSDFTPGWYAAVGQGLMTTMFLQIIVPHIGIFIGLRGMMGKWRNTKLYEKSTRETTLRSMLLGPHMDFGLRLAQITNHLYVTYVFATGMPLMIVAGFLGSLVSYFVDKLALLRLYRRPAFGSKALLSSMSGLLPIAAVLHIALGAWIIGTVYQLDDGDTEIVDPVAAASAPGGGRLLSKVGAFSDSNLFALSSKGYAPTPSELEAAGFGAEAAVEPSVAPRVDLFTTIGLHGMHAMGAAATTAAAFVAPEAWTAAAAPAAPAAAAAVARSTRRAQTSYSNFGCACTSACAASARTNAPWWRTQGLKTCDVDPDMCWYHFTDSAGQAYDTCEEDANYAVAGYVNCLSKCADPTDLGVYGPSSAKACVVDSDFYPAIPDVVLDTVYTPASGMPSTTPARIAQCSSPSFYGCGCESPCMTSGQLTSLAAGDGVTIDTGVSDSTEICTVDLNTCYLGTFLGEFTLGNVTRTVGYDYCGSSSPYGGANSDDAKCLVQWYSPECAGSSAGGGAAAELQGLLFDGAQDDGALAQMTFLKDPTLLRTLAGKTSTATTGSSGVDAGVFSSISLDRVFSTGGVPLFGMLIATIVLSLLFTFVRWSWQALVALKEYLLPSKNKHDGEIEQGDRTVPFSRAVLGEKALQDYRKLSLVGRTYAIEAQEAIYQDYALDAVLGEVCLDIQAGHLLFARTEHDGVLESSYGMAFLAPLFWNSSEGKEAFLARNRAEGKPDITLPPAVALDKRGYRAELKEWFDAAEAIAGLDSRIYDDRPFQRVDFEHTWRARLAADAAAAAAVPAPAAGGGLKLRELGASIAATVAAASAEPEAPSGRSRAESSSSSESEDEEGEKEAAPADVKVEAVA